ncbi:MAG TPA: metalloregulator ArsR/SmtB family transcription factor [Firmicutes bacterium]|nr:metalloregulator ArsR/SmtB family transcription factor [Bacillota bacterium]
MSKQEEFEVPVCDYIHANPELVASLKEQTPDDGLLVRLAELFKIFGDPTRVKILYVLLEHEMCVCDIALLLGMSQSSISHQLRILKQSSLVKFRREGKSVIYSLADDHVITILNQGFEHVTES